MHPFVTRNCAAITADVSQLAYERIALKNRAKDFDILPDVIAKDPLAPTYRLGDPALVGHRQLDCRSLDPGGRERCDPGESRRNAAERRSGDPALARHPGRLRPVYRPRRRL